MVRPSQRRKMARQWVEGGRTNIRHACRTFEVSETCFRYQARANEENARIADWLVRLTTVCRDWGFGRCFLHLRNVKGFGWNHKRVYRIYRELELNLRIKPKKRLVRERPEPLAVPDAVNEVWSMDFMHDQRGALLAWAERQGIHLEHIQPGKLQQNAYVERYNRTVRYAWLARTLFDSIKQAQDKATRWLWAYNHERPNMALGCITPMQKLAPAA
jgi:hypothetical protein